MENLLTAVAAASKGPSVAAPVYDGSLDATTWYFAEDEAIDPIDLSGAFSGDDITFSSNGLPTGLSLASDTGILTGTPTTSGTYAVDITATNAGGSDGPQDIPTMVIDATGGTKTKIDVGGQKYLHWLFTGDGTWTPNFTSSLVEYLIVGGGASGGRGIGAGGGGGADPETSTTSVTASTGYPIVVGPKGAKQNVAAAQGNDGTASSAFGVSNAGGGGGGAGSGGTAIGRDGGAGGGGGSNGSAGTRAGGDGTEANDRDGGTGNDSTTGSQRHGGGGGGGAATGGNATSSQGGTGADGLSLNFRGTTISYGGGGGGQGQTAPGAGGDSGTSGGNGSLTTGTATNPNGQTPGSGGGGHNHATQDNGGADGVVEIRVPLAA